MPVLAHHEDLRRAVALGGVPALAQRHDGHGVVVGHGLAAHRCPAVGQEELLVLDGEDRTAPHPLARTDRSAGVAGVLELGATHFFLSLLAPSESGSSSRWEA